MLTEKLELLEQRLLSTKDKVYLNVPCYCTILSNKEFNKQIIVTVKYYSALENVSYPSGSNFFFLQATIYNIN